MDAYRVLGVSRESPPDVVTSAYRTLARVSHPDAHPTATPDERARYEHVMATLNDAYAHIRAEWRDPVARAVANDAAAPPPAHPPDTCSICGWSPVLVSTLEFQEGIVFARRRYSMHQPFCRECSLAVGRAYQNRTLLTGWWGVTLFLTNFGVIARNARALRRAARARRPRRGQDGAPDGPLDRGQSVFLRPGSWAVLASVVFLVAIVLGTGMFRSGHSGAPLAVGSCLRGVDPMVVVSCTDVHDAVVVRGAAEPRSCPPSADSYVTLAGRTYCVRNS